MHQIGTFAYHFWMFDMKARRRNDAPKDHIFTKFLAKRADTNKMQGFQLAA